MSETTAAAKPSVEGGFRTDAERTEAARIQSCFERNPESWPRKMENFPKYVRRQNLTRFLRSSLPNLHVIAWNEIPDNRKVRLVTAVGK